VGLDEPPSLNSQIMPTHPSAPALVRCGSEQAFSFPTPMFAVPPTRGRETRTSVCAAAVGTGRGRSCESVFIIGVRPLICSNAASDDRPIKPIKRMDIPGGWNSWVLMQLWINRVQIHGMGR
jgi:hypothetical protein